MPFRYTFGSKEGVHFCAASWFFAQLHCHRVSAVGFQFWRRLRIYRTGGQQFRGLKVSRMGTGGLHDFPEHLRVLQHGAGAQMVVIEGLTVVIGHEDGTAHRSRLMSRILALE